MSRQPAASQFHGASNATCSTVTPAIVDGAPALAPEIAVLPMRRASLCGTAVSRAKARRSLISIKSGGYPGATVNRKVVSMPARRSFLCSYAFDSPLAELEPPAVRQGPVVHRLHRLAAERDLRHLRPVGVG